MLCSIEATTLIPQGRRFLYAREPLDAQTCSLESIDTKATVPVLVPQQSGTDAVFGNVHISLNQCQHFIAV